MRKTSLIFLAALFFVAANISLPVYGQGQNEKEIHYKQLSKEERWKQAKNFLRELQKTSQDDERHDQFKETIVNGNQIRVLLTNQGSISTPDADAANADLVWPNGPTGLGYGYEFGPMLAAEVIDENGDTIHAVSEGFIDGGDFEPGTGKTVRWGWEPKLGFSDPNSNEVATFTDLDRNLDGKPDSWPESWFNETLGRYVWPAFLGDDATTPDEEVYYVMDDFDNEEFNYLPIPGNPTIHGLALELQVRIFQFNNALAEDIIFLVYTVTNVGSKNLDKVYLGMFGDPHIGGPANFADDNAGFISAFDENFPPNVRNMLFAWDTDGIGDGGKIPGYFGYRFLESPGIDDDNDDNDNDGLWDESQFNDAGVFEFRTDFGRYRGPGFAWTGDEDGDWIEEIDDVGVDGIANTGDFGEGDGKPNQLFYLDLNNNGILDLEESTSESRLEGYRFFGGEPNFGFLDVAESDQIGLTSFNAIRFGGANQPRNDQLMWEKMSTRNQRPGDPPPQILQEADNVFIYGSGAFELKPGESQRFSIALLLGIDFDDLLSNAEISQQVFESDYRFAQAPKKPILTVVPGDKQVTLYWDLGAEDSFDPFVARANPDSAHKGFDFEGYRIYRSQDWSFNDTKTITDSRGVPFLSKPLKKTNGAPAQFDLINEFAGLHPIEYVGRGVRYDVGNNTGLVHSFVDSNNVLNGVTYFYAITSYDHGDIDAMLAPSECQRVIQRDAVTRQFSFDVNTAMVVPGPPATGFTKPYLENSEDNQATQEVGNATGKVWVEFLDPLKVKDNKKYDVIFEEVEIDSVTKITGYSVIDLELREVKFIAKGVSSVNLLLGGQYLKGSIPSPGSQMSEGSIIVKDLSGAVVDTSRYKLDLANGRIWGTSEEALPRGEEFTITFQIKPVAASASVNSEEDNPVFDGIKLFVQNYPTALDTLNPPEGKSGFKSIVTNTNFSNELTKIGLAKLTGATPYPSDFEIRFVDYDTTADGSLANPADSGLVQLDGGVKTPFRIIDIETGERIDFAISEVNGLRNRRWDWQEAIILLEPDHQQIIDFTYQVAFSLPSDTLVSSTGEKDSVVFEDPIYPGEGDVFFLFSHKQFDPGDKYTLTAKAATFSKQEARLALKEVIVVPNPYIAFSAGEIAGVRTGDRDDRKIYFRNLPPKCTIRIYTIVGELVDKIEKNDNRDFAAWDLLTFESQEIAYGVYIYHIDAPGIGTKVGRFGVIK